jgi:hypothetical protein
MHARILFRRVALFAASLAFSGVLGTVASTPAFAFTETAIFGSGAALQNQLQNNVLIPNDTLAGPSVTFTATTSGAGFNEFGNNTGVLDPTQDPTASPVIDSFVGTDSAPTLAQLATVKNAAGSDEVTVPVAQTPLDLIVNLPSSVKVGGTLKLSNVLVSEAYGGTLPSDSPYPANSWGALLLLSGLSVGSSSNGTTFTDTGTLKNGTGAYQQLQVEVRKNGAGTTQNVKDYEFAVNTLKGSGPWASPILDDSNAYGTNEWPSGASLKPTSTGNSTDAAEVSAVLANPGTLGYATAGDAASGGFTNTPQTEPTTKTQNLYALVQNNGVATSGATYADPEANNTGQPNVFTGAVNVNGSGGVGNWNVPQGTSKYNVLGSWAGTVASDPTVSGDGGKATNYPIVAVAYDLSFLNFASLTVSGSSKPSSNAGPTTQDYLTWAATLKNGGQTAISTYGTAKGDDDFYYAPLPTGNTGINNVQADAATSAEAVNSGS